jgi:hypothetical protein
MAQSMETRMLESSAPEDERTPPRGIEPAIPRRRGRPLLMTGDAVLDRIRSLASRQEGLFRIHRTHPGLYARARRLFGSWSAAVAEAGIDYVAVIGVARDRALRSRRQRARRRVRAAR